MTNPVSSRLAALEQQLRVPCQHPWLKEYADTLAALLPEVQRLEQENQEMKKLPVKSKKVP